MVSYSLYINVNSYLASAGWKVTFSSADRQTLSMGAPLSHPSAKQSTFAESSCTDGGCWYLKVEGQQLLNQPKCSES